VVYWRNRYFICNNIDKNTGTDCCQAVMWKSRLSKFIPKATLFFSGALTCVVCLHILSAFDENQEFVLTDSFVLDKNKNGDAIPSDQKTTKMSLCESAEKNSGTTTGWDFADQSFDGNRGSSRYNNNTIWVVTPTFYRPEQKPELTRLAQTLLLVRSFVHWLVVDDIGQGSDASFRDLKLFLSKYTPALKITFLRSIGREPNKDKIVGKPRGVGGRRAAIQWLRDNKAKGVVYFADDDNTYYYDIFRQVSSFVHYSIQTGWIVRAERKLLYCY